MKLIPGFGDGLYDFGSSDADILANLTNDYPDWLNTDKVPVLYRTLQNTGPAAWYAKQQELKKKKGNEIVPFDALRIGDIRLGMLAQRMAGDLVGIMNDIITWQVTPATFTQGTRGFTLGVLFIIIAMMSAFFGGGQISSR